MYPAHGWAPLQIFVLGLVFLLIALTIDITYALAAGTVGVWLRRRPGLGRTQSVGTGLAYLGLVAWAAFASGDRPSR